MPGTTIGVSMNVGFAGTQSRTADAIIQNRVADGNIAFGQAAKLTTANKWKAIGSGDQATDVAGIAIREVVQANQFNPQANSDYVDGQACDVLVRGNCTVKCQRGTPVPGTAVYVRVAENASYPGCVIGGFEASSDSTNTIQVSNIEWTTGVIDSNLITEVTVKTRAKG